MQSSQVHIWPVDLDHLKVPENEAAQMLPEPERIKSEHFRFEVLRMRYIKRHLLLRVLLGWYLGVDFYNQEFCYNQHGKPSLKNVKDLNPLYFNLSDCENICVCVFTQDGDVGVDVEKIHNLSDMGRIVERFFSSLENKKFCALPEQSIKKTFFKYWTRKEALSKAMGVGLSFPLDKLDVLSDKDDISQVSITNSDQNVESEWTLCDINTFEGFASALALEGKHTDCKARLQYFKFYDEIIIRPKKSDRLHL